MFDEDAPELKPGEMYYVDNVGSMSFTCSYERGTAVLFDRDKYCVYSHFGPTCSLGLLPIEGVVSQGVVMNVWETEDYEGPFFGNTATTFEVGGVDVAVGFNMDRRKIVGQKAEYCGSVFASMGFSLQWFETEQQDWIYGRAPIEIKTHILPIYGPDYYNDLNF